MRLSFAKFGESAGRRFSHVGVAACFIAATFGGVHCALGVSLDAANGFGGGFAAVKCYAEVADGRLVVSDIGKDHRIVWADLSLDPNSSLPVVIRYRATGTGKDLGQFFWSHAGEDFSRERYCELPPPVADGAWHELTLTAKELGDAWTKGGAVTAIRYDPTDSPDGRIEIESVRLGSASGDASVAAFPKPEGLDEDLWPAVRPQFLTPKTSVRTDAGARCEVKALAAAPETDRAHGGTTVNFRFRFEGPRPAAPFSASVEFLFGGRVCWTATESFEPAAACPVDGTVWDLAVPVRLPLRFSTRKLSWRFVSADVIVREGGIPGGAFTLLRARTPEDDEGPLVSGVKQVNGSPEFFVNGRPFTAIWGVAQTKRPDGLTRAGAFPFNVLTVWNWPGKWIAPDGSVLTAQFDQRAERILSENPDAYLMWDLTVSPCAKWRHAHPDEIVVDDQGGRKSYDTVPEHSMASKSAAEDMSRSVEKAIAYLESSPYANRILGYRISGGETPEWLAFRPERGRVYDFSPIAKGKFAKWAKVRYPELVEAVVPSLADRRALDDGALLWSDPKRHLSTIAFHEFYSDAVADMIIETSRRAKAALGGRKLVGTYCGYTMYLNVNGCDHMRAHFALKKVLDAKAVDFIMSPQTYTHGVRRLGGTLADMKPFRSLEENGVVPVIENDLRTHNARPGMGYQQTLTPYQSVMAIRRDFSVELCRRHPVYALNMCSGLDLDFPELEEDGRIYRTLVDHLAACGLPRRMAEVALVVGEKTILGMPMLNRYAPSDAVEQEYQTNGLARVKRGGIRPILTGEVFGDMPLRFARAGAPVDYLLAEDLADHPGDYKLYVFAVAYVSDDRLVQAAEKLRARGASVLWLYAPGYTKGTVSSLASMRELTGIDFAQNAEPLAAEAKMADGRMMGRAKELVKPTFVPQNPDEVLGTYANGRPAVASVRTGRSVSYFCGTWKLDDRFLRELYRRAGVHVYTAATDPIEANEKLFTLHARFAGVKDVKLPRKTDVLDVCGRRIVARQADAFSFTAPLHSTSVFYCGDDAGELLEKLNGKAKDR